MAIWLIALLFSCTAESAAPGPEERNEIFAEIHDLYDPVAKAAGGELVIEQKTESDLAVATADLTEGKFKVILHGGLLRSPKLNRDILRFTLCHELGHLFGGPPFQPAPPEWDGPSQGTDTLFSSEGQADFYAALGCFRRLAASKGASDAPTALVERCDLAWGKGADSLVCQRAALAGYSLLRLVKDFPLSFETPDPSIAPKTIRGEYPGRQCRLDTILAAATCLASSPLDMRKEAPPCSSRPACWFRE